MSIQDLITDPWDMPKMSVIILYASCYSSLPYSHCNHISHLEGLLNFYLLLVHISDKENEIYFGGMQYWYMHITFWLILSHYPIPFCPSFWFTSVSLKVSKSLPPSFLSSVIYLSFISSVHFSGNDINLFLMAE